MEGLCAVIEYGRMMCWYVMRYEVYGVMVCVGEIRNRDGVWGDDVLIQSRVQFNLFFNFV